MAPRAFITATNSSVNSVISGWVSCGNHFQPFSVLDVSDKLCFAMTFPEPKKFTSDVVVYTKSGVEKSGVVEVNKPLTAGSWKVYQYSYDTRAGRDSEISVFELVYDPWIIPVYAGNYSCNAGVINTILERRKKGMSWSEFIYFAAGSLILWYSGTLALYEVEKGTCGASLLSCG